MTDLTITELDTLRANVMACLMNEKGRQEIWKYDVIEAKEALAEARYNQDFDNIVSGANAVIQGTRYALVGPGITDHHFTTPAELTAILVWLCQNGGYLSCYAHLPYGKF